MNLVKKREAVKLSTRKNCTALNYHFYCEHYKQFTS